MRANLGIIHHCATAIPRFFRTDSTMRRSLTGRTIIRGRLNRYLHCNMADLKRNSRHPVKKIKSSLPTHYSAWMATARRLRTFANGREIRCMVMVDEAHATAFRKDASGLVEELGLSKTLTFENGHALKNQLRTRRLLCRSDSASDYFVNTSRSLIYSTGLPHSVLAHDLAAIRYIRSHPGNGKNASWKASRFRSGLVELGFSTLNSTTHIVPCIFGEEKTALSASEFCLSNGIKVPAIRPPTVPAHTARLRFSLHADLTEENLEYVLTILGK